MSNRVNEKGKRARLFSHIFNVWTQAVFKF